MRLACTAGRCEECPSREWCNAYLAINQTSRSGAAPGSMSEIGNVPIFSGSESRFREGPLEHDVRNDRCDKCNYLRSIKSTSTGVWAAAGIRSGEKMLPIEAPDRRRPSSLVYESYARILSRLSARPLVAVQHGVAYYESKVSRRAARSIFLHILTSKLSLQSSPSNWIHGIM